MLPVLLVEGVFGLVLCHLCCILWDKIQNHRMSMPFLPSGRTSSVSPVLSYCFSHTSGICTLLLSPSMLPPLFVEFGMTIIWVHSGYCLSGRPSIRTSFWFNSIVCRWTREISVNLVKQFLSCWNHYSSVWFSHFQWYYRNFRPLCLFSLLGLSLNVHIC